MSTRGQSPEASTQGNVTFESDGDLSGDGKSVANLKPADQRAASSSKFNHGDAVIVKIDGKDKEVWAENPEQHPITKKWGYQLSDQDGGYLDGGKPFPEDRLRKDVKRKSRK